MKLGYINRKSLLDNLSIEQRRYAMSRIRSRGTKPELVLRKSLFALGFRFRLHKKNLPGKPDLVFSKYNSVVFIHGCFWHLHNNCSDGRLPKSKLEYWAPKLNRNVERDLQHQTELGKLGWRVFVVWECQIKKDLNEAVQKTASFLLEGTS